MERTSWECKIVSTYPSHKQGMELLMQEVNHSVMLIAFLDNNSCIHDQSTEKFSENRTHQQGRWLKFVHSVHSSSLHLTTLTCLQEVNTSPSLRIQNFLSCHQNHSGGGPVYSNWWVLAHQKNLVPFLENRQAGAPVQVHF